MTNEYHINLDQVIDLPSWAQLQEMLAGMGGVTLMIYGEAQEGAAINGTGACSTHGSICIVSPSIVPISSDNPYCRTLRESEKGRPLCESYCTRSMHRVTELGTPLIFQCYAGLMNFSIPLVPDGNHRFILLGGRVFETPLNDGTLAEVAAQTNILREHLKELADKTPIKPLDDFRSCVNNIEKLSTFVLKSTFQKNRVTGKVSRLKALMSVGVDLAAKGSREDVYQLFFNSLGFLYGVQHSSVMHFDPATGRHQTVRAFGPLSAGIERYSCTDTDGLAVMVLEHRSFLYINNVFDLLRAGLSDEVTSCFIFPVFSDERLTGMVNIFNLELSEDELHVVAAFCRYLFSAVETAGLRDSIRRHMDTLFTLNEACSAFCDDMSVEDLFHTILDKSAAILRAEQGSLMLFNEESRDLVVKATTGFSAKLVEHFRIRPGEGIAGMVIASGTPILVEDIASDPRLAANRRQRYKTGSFMSMPLAWKDRPLGVLNLADKVDGSAFGQQDLHLMGLLSRQASLALDRARLLEHTKELRRLSVTDALTGLFSRRYLEEMLSEEIERTLRYGRSLALVMIDLDNFKPYNDRYGHQAGDELLRELGRVLHGAVRAIDAAVRYGGDEFAVILPETDPAGAVIIAERISQEVNSSIMWYCKGRKTSLTQQTAVGDVDGKAEDLSLSMGIAAVPKDAKTVKDLISMADRALYAAKAKGKNRIEVYSGKENAGPWYEDPQSLLE